MKTWIDFSINIPTGASGHIRTTCPQCSPTRKKSNEKCLSVDIDQEVYFCHHCGWCGGLKGESTDFVRKIFAKPSFIATRLPIEVIEWFNKRGIQESTLKANSIAYGPSFGSSSGIQFPYFKDGSVVNIKHRSLNKEFRQEKDAEKCLYRFDEIAKIKGDTLIITEGEIDALSIQTIGYEMVTSIPDGAPSADSKTFATKFDFLKSAEQILQKYRKIILAMDSDAPGQVAQHELARRIGVERCYRIFYPEGCKDANDVLVKHGSECLKSIIENAKPFPIEGLYQAMSFADEVMALYAKGEDRGYCTGWKSLDEYYRISPGLLTVITGIPGAGKSNFLDCLLINLIRLHGWRFAIFSPENWPVQKHIQTLLEKYIEHPFYRDGRETRRMTENEMKDGLLTIDENFHFILPKEDILSVDVILEKARIAIYRYGIHGLVIDPWNEVEHLLNGLTEAQYLSKELTKIRRFARTNQIHVWIVAHPKNLIKDQAGNYKPPTMYEISGGAHWRNKADNGLCLHRPDYNKDETEVYVQKIRFRENGRIGKCKLNYISDTGEYCDSAH